MAQTQALIIPLAIIFGVEIVVMIPPILVILLFLGGLFPSLLRYPTYGAFSVGILLRCPFFNV
jgi:hypothetical protein